MPFIPDDRKLLCCQDAAAEIEGRSNISIFQFESHWNELVKMGEKKKKKEENEKESPGKQKGANKDTIFFCRESTLLIFSPGFLLLFFFFFFFFACSSVNFFTSTVANHMVGF